MFESLYGMALYKVIHVWKCCSHATGKWRITRSDFEWVDPHNPERNSL
jgi:hypothetical protein